MFVDEIQDAKIEGVDSNQMNYIEPGNQVNDI